MKWILGLGGTAIMLVLCALVWVLVYSIPEHKRFCKERDGEYIMLGTHGGWVCRDTKTGVLFR